MLKKVARIQYVYSIEATEPFTNKACQLSLGWKTSTTTFGNSSGTESKSERTFVPSPWKIIIIGKQVISLISVLKRIKATLQHTVNVRLWGSPVIDPTTSKQKNISDHNPHGIKHPPLAFNVMNSICDEVLKLKKSTMIPVLSGHGIKLTASIKRKVAEVPKFIFPIYFKWNLY